MFSYVLGFLLLLGPLVFVHELGHYLFAKLFNVRVDTFSMGFGPKIFKKTKGETEYCLSIIPLGGYVKLFGQDPTEVVEPENAHRALKNIAPWKRFLVFVGGPLFNFLFAIVVFSAILIIGEEHVMPIAARVTPGSQAALAGLKTGDLITAVNSKPVSKFEEVAKIISDNPKKSVALQTKRDEQLTVINVTPRSAPGRSIYGEAIEVGEVEGLHAFGRYTAVGVSNPKSAAGMAGLKTGDEITAINGKKVTSWEEIEAILESNQKSDGFEVTYVPHTTSYWGAVKRDPILPSAEKKVTVRGGAGLGLYSSELFVSHLVPDSPAATLGVLAGDRLDSIDGVSLLSFPQLRDLVQKAGETKGAFKLRVERDGKFLDFDIKPTVNIGQDIQGNEIRQYVMGVFPLAVHAEPKFFVERIFNPLTLVAQSVFRSLDLSAKTVISLKKLFTREVSMGTLGGPLLIGKLAGESLARGIISFLRAMALISISLAIFNMLPVPILDGGHIVILGVEVLRGKPISMRHTELVQQVGVSLIALLLLVVLFNDFSRVGLPALKQMFQ